MVKHYNWRFKDEGGRIAVSLDNDRLTIARLCGRAMPAEGLVPLLDVFSYDEDLDEEKDNYSIYSVSRELHRSRRHPWATEIIRGMSGCVDIRLRFQRNPFIMDHPVGGAIHISMCGKLNQGVSLWLGDLMPLFDAADAAGIDLGRDGENRDEFDFVEAEVFIPINGWKYGAAEPAQAPIETIRRVAPPEVEVVNRIEGGAE